MTLPEYLKATGESVYTFAERAGLQRSTVSGILQGRTNPRVDIAEKIVLATGKVVGWSDLVVRQRR